MALLAASVFGGSAITTAVAAPMAAIHQYSQLEAIRSKPAQWVEIIGHDAVLHESEVKVVVASSLLNGANSRSRRRARLSRERTVPTGTFSTVAISS